MSDEAKKDLLHLIVFLVLVGLLWFIVGGYKKEQRSLFLDVKTTQTGVEISEKNVEGGDIQDIEVTATPPSEYKDLIDIYSRNSKRSEPGEEYIEIRSFSSNKNPIDITDWTLSGKNETSIKIPTAVGIYKSGVTNTRERVILNPGEKAIIITGKSPLGEGFRLNKCMGYFTKTKDFVPSIYTECPYPKYENWPAGLSDECLDYIDTLPRCTANFSIPLGLDNNCRTSINKTINYNSCIDIHKDEEDFFKKEWRIYLNRSDEIWKQSRETINLYDIEGNLVDSVSY